MFLFTSIISLNPNDPNRLDTISNYCFTDDDDDDSDDNGICDLISVWSIVWIKNY